MIPKLKGEVGIGGTQAANEVIFERLDGAFHGIDLMVVWLHKLHHSILGFHEGLDRCRSLVIHDIEGWRETFFGQGIEDTFECCDDVRALRGHDWDGKNIVSVVVVRNEEELLA